MGITFLSSSINPDSSSIAYKDQIDISLSLVDVSASGQSASIYTNYSATVQKVTVPEPNLLDRSVYYTPIYKEKLNYNVWLNRINKNFDELD